MMLIRKRFADCKSICIAAFPPQCIVPWLFQMSHDCERREGIWNRMPEKHNIELINMYIYIYIYYLTVAVSCLSLFSLKNYVLRLKCISVCIAGQLIRIFLFYLRQCSFPLILLEWFLLPHWFSVIHISARVAFTIILIYKCLSYRSLFTCVFARRYSCDNYICFTSIATKYYESPIINFSWHICTAMNQYHCL